MKLLQMDSMHINLQNLRWPFLSRYSVPTVLGTPTSLTVQSTVLSSLRGNISQKMEGIGVSRSHEIDLRYVLPIQMKSTQIQSYRIDYVYL